MTTSEMAGEPTASTGEPAAREPGAGRAAPLRRVLARRRAALIAGQLLWALALTTGVLLSDGIPSAVHTEPKTPGTGLFFGILANNAGVAALAFSGVATFGLTTIPFTLVSGIGVGVFVGHAYALEGGSGGAFWPTFLPHAAIELPALGFAVAAGLVTGIAAVRRMVSGRRGEGMGAHFVDSAVLFGISLAMLVVAAGVETWISAR
ncbi:stage II sporulation protein M [Streptomyces pathocidini]|uniref:stage II sporulation protein M n=1 Tax=Streptomyces pathocidini TaxID=1650571 RepID=UPI0033D28B49